MKFRMEEESEETETLRDLVVVSRGEIYLKGRKIESVSELYPPKLISIKGRNHDRIPETANKRKVPLQY